MMARTISGLVSETSLNRTRVLTLKKLSTGPAQFSSILAYVNSEYKVPDGVLRTHLSILKEEGPITYGSRGYKMMELGEKVYAELRRQ